MKNGEVEFSNGFASHEGTPWRVRVLTASSKRIFTRLKAGGSLQNCRAGTKHKIGHKQTDKTGQRGDICLNSVVGFSQTQTILESFLLKPGFQHSIRPVEHMVCVAHSG